MAFLFYPHNALGELLTPPIESVQNRAPPDHDLPAGQRWQNKHKHKHKQRLHKSQDIGEYTFFCCVKTCGCDTENRNKGHGNQKDRHYFAISVFTTSDAPNNTPRLPFVKYMIIQLTRDRNKANTYASFLVLFSLSKFPSP